MKNYIFFQFFVFSSIDSIINIIENVTEHKATAMNDNKVKWVAINNERQHEQKAEI